MRSLLVLVYLSLIAFALRALLRWVVQGSRKPAPQSGEMVRDPRCGTFILKDAAVTRRLRGETVHFCGEACAAAYEP